MILSICIPSFNRFEKLVPSITELLKSPSSDFEVVIVDNCSTESMSELLAIKDNRLRIIKREIAVYGPKNITECLKYALGEYAMLCLDKDRVDWRHIEDFVIALKNNDYIAGGYCVQNKSDDQYNIEIVSEEPILKLGYLNKHPSGDFYKTSCLKFLFENIKEDDVINSFSFDYFLAFCSTQGSMMIYNKPLVYLEKAKDAKATKSLSFTRKANNLFFFPDNRIKEFKRQILHMDQLNISNETKVKKLRSLYRYNLNAVTFGFEDIMKNDMLCEHYRVEGKNIDYKELNQYRKQLNSLLYEFKIDYISTFKKKLWILVDNTKINIKLWHKKIVSIIRM